MEQLIGPRVTLFHHSYHDTIANDLRAQKKKRNSSVCTRPFPLSPLSNCNSQPGNSSCGILRDILRSCFVCTPIFYLTPLFLLSPIHLIITSANLLFSRHILIQPTTLIASSSSPLLSHCIHRNLFASILCKLHLG